MTKMNQIFLPPIDIDNSDQLNSFLLHIVLSEKFIPPQAKDTTLEGANAFQTLEIRRTTSLALNGRSRKTKQAISLLESRPHCLVQVSLKKLESLNLFFD